MVERNLLKCDMGVTSTKAVQCGAQLQTVCQADESGCRDPDACANTVTICIPRTERRRKGHTEEGCGRPEASLLTMDEEENYIAGVEEDGCPETSHPVAINTFDKLTQIHLEIQAQLHLQESLIQGLLKEGDSLDSAPAIQHDEHVGVPPDDDIAVDVRLRRKEDTKASANAEAKADAQADAQEDSHSETLKADIVPALPALSPEPQASLSAPEPNALDAVDPEADVLPQADHAPVLPAVSPDPEVAPSAPAKSTTDGVE